MIVTSKRTGKRGRPRKELNDEWITDATDNRRQLSKKELAECAGIDPRTLSRVFEEKGHPLSHNTNTVSNDELRRLAEEFKLERPSQGYRMFKGWLSGKGIRASRSRVINAMDPVDRAMRRPARRRRRRKYKVEGSNTLWHMDGHHKLIPWRFVIHGVIDGYDRTVRDHLSLLNKRPTLRFLL